MSIISPELIKEQMRKVPLCKLTVVYDFVSFLVQEETERRRTESRQTMLAAEAVVSRDWLSPEEDAAWAHL